MWHPPGSHSYVLLNKEIVVSTDDGTALIVDSLVEKAFLRQVFFPFFDIACLNISSCFACSFLGNPPPCQQFLQEVVVLSSALSIQGFCFSSSSFIFGQIHYMLGFSRMPLSQRQWLCCGDFGGGFDRLTMSDCANSFWVAKIISFRC